MANEKILQTVIVLRNDSSTKWADSEVVMLKGEMGIAYLDNDNVIVKVGNGEDKWADLPQVESVLEQDVLLTHSFGKHTVAAGSFLNAGGKNQTFSQWFQEALKETVNPTITQPNATLSASAPNSGDSLEIGSYITKLNWAGTPSVGSYAIGEATQATGLAADDFTWAISNSVDAQTSALEDGTFTLTSDKQIQINSDTASNYARIDATVTIDPTDAKAPKNNLGEDVDGKITGFDAAGTKTKTLSATVSVTGYRKPFWGVIEAADNLKAPTDYVSADVRDLPNNATKAKGFPTSLAVPAGSQMVVFFAKAGVYSSLTATDDKAMNAGVSFEKVANAVQVEGANGFTATDYDLWYVDWKAGIGAAKQLTLKWS